MFQSLCYSEDPAFRSFDTKAPWIVIDRVRPLGWNATIHPNIQAAGEKRQLVFGKLNF